MAVVIVDKKVQHVRYMVTRLSIYFRARVVAVYERRKGREKEREDTVKFLYLLT